MNIKDIKDADEFKKVLELLQEAEHEKRNYKFSLEKRWLSGGIGGGSCWDDYNSDEEDPHYEIFGDMEPEDNTLEVILNYFMIEIKLDEYPDYVFWNEEQETEYEYYGNSSIYTTKSLDYKSLFETLRKEAHNA